MRNTTRFYRLSLLYRQLDDALRREARRRGGSAFRLLRLKAAKLAVKRRLSAQMVPALAR